MRTRIERDEVGDLRAHEEYGQAAEVRREVDVVRVVVDEEHGAPLVGQVFGQDTALEFGVFVREFRLEDRVDLASLAGKRETVPLERGEEAVPHVGLVPSGQVEDRDVGFGHGPHELERSRNRDVERLVGVREEAVFPERPERFGERTQVFLVRFQVLGTRFRERVRDPVADVADAEGADRPFQPDGAVDRRGEFADDRERPRPVVEQRAVDVQVAQREFSVSSALFGQLGHLAQRVGSFDRLVSARGHGVPPFMPLLCLSALHHL